MTSWTEGAIEGVQIRPARKYRDARGWLAEMFRSDELPAPLMPAMAYVSSTRPGVARGPHEHLKQTDLFAFFGPGSLALKLWDNRPESPTYGKWMRLTVGEDNPAVVVVPPRVIHGYRNISAVDAWVINLPNDLYAGKGRKQPVDEVRYEDQKDSPFVLTD